MKVIRLYGIGFTLMLVASIAIYVIPHGVRNDVGTVHQPQTEKKLISQIPMFRVSADRKRVYPTPLRKADQVVVHDEDDIMYESWVVMDKVVVIPKVIG